MKIRIGNDICLNVTLLGDNGDDYLNIKTIRAYLINVTKQKNIDESHRRDSIKYHDEIEDRQRTVKYISRFPAEPMSHAYHGTPYDLCHSGHPTFHVHPAYCVAPYIGFGVHPHTFDPFHNHLWGYDDMMDLHSRMLHNEERYKEEYSQCEFLAPVMATDAPNKVKVLFPAESQLSTGIYKLVIMAKVYEPGYSPSGLRTITMDYNTVFEIVGSSDEAGTTGDVQISVGNLKPALYINVTAPASIPVGHTSTLYASVLPADIDNTDVEWTVLGEGSKYLVLAAQNGNKVPVWAVGLPEDTKVHPVEVRATSKKTRSVYKDVTINITADAIVDNYTVDAQHGDNGKTGNDRNEYINLILRDGQTVAIDTTKETVWYEGD